MKKNIKNFLFSLLMFALMMTTVSAYERNLNFSITSASSRIDSGETANFIVDLKTTGSNKNMTDVDIHIDLPEDFELETRLEDLSLMGKVPSHENGKLKYHFPKLNTGISERMLIGFKTRNGHDLNNESVILTYSLSSEETEIQAGKAEVKINASGSITAAKELLDVDGGGPYKPAGSNSKLTWQLRVSSNKRNRAQLFLKEGSKIHVTDQLPRQVVYIKDSHNGKYDPKNHSVSWTFDAPSYEQQEAKEDYLFLETIQVETRVRPINNNEYYFKLDNKLNTSAVLVDGTTVKDNTTANVVLSRNQNTIPPVNGSYFRSAFRGPMDDKGNVGVPGNIDPRPSVHDTATLAFTHLFYSHPGGNTHLWVNGNLKSDNGDFSNVNNLNVLRINKEGYKWIRNDYSIDEKLVLDKIILGRPFYHFSNKVEAVPIPTQELPIGVLYLKDANDNEVVHRIDYRELNGQRLMLDIKDLFEDPDTVITEMRIVIKPNEHQNVIDGRIGFPNLATTYYKVKPGAVGMVENKVKTTFVHGGSGKTVTYDGVKESSAMGPRKAEILPKPKGTLPIAETTIKLDKDTNGMIFPGKNTLDLVFRNIDGSLDRINGNYEMFVKVTKGVDLLLDKVKVPYPYKLLAADHVKSTEYDNIYKFTFSGAKLGILPADQLQVKIPVNISENKSSRINMDIYAHSRNKSLKVPQYPAVIPTNTVIVSDNDELVGLNLLHSDHNYIKSENHYSIIKNEKVHTKKSVKGDLDDNYSDFAHVSAGGDVAYRLELDHNVDSSLREMVILDVLPSVGDLGITDNEARGSQFSLELDGGIELNERMKEKFDVYYSTSAHPKRDDLSNVADNQLENPSHSEDVNWLLKEEVNGWSNIKSFKIQLKPGLRWSNNEKLVIDFMMKAPSSLDDELITISKDDEYKYEKAAWNSFAVAMPNLHVVEPLKVGVAVIDDIEVQEPIIDKHVNVDGELYKDVDVDSNENISYLIEVNLPASINAYENLVITDKLHEHLELVSVILNGKPVENNHSEPNHIHVELSRNELFELKKQGKDRIEVEVVAKINKISLDENLESIPIPNTAKVTVNNKVTVQPEKPTNVKPIVEYGTLIAVVTEGDNAIVKRNTVDEFSEKRLIGSSVRVKSYDDNPFEIDFSTKTDAEDLIHRLPVGKYILQQDKVIDGYIKTEESIVVEVINNELTVIEVLNPKEPTPAEFISSKSVSVDTGRSYATGGDVLTYGITIENIGESTGTVRVTDTLEFIEEYVVIDEDQEILIHNLESENVYTVKDLMSGIEFDLSGNTQVQLFFTVRLNADFDETSFELVNKAQVNDEEIETRITVKTPRIEIIKTVVDENINEIADANESLSYKIVVSNTGDHIAENVLISDSMINLKDYVELPDTVNVSQNDSQVEMDIETLQTGFVRDIDVDQPLIIEYDVIVKEGLAEGQSLVNTAFANEEESTVTIKHHKPLLEILKLVKDENSNGYAESEERLTYEIHVRNIGLVDAKDVFVIDTLEQIMPYIEEPSNEQVYHNETIIGTVAELQEGIAITNLKAGEEFIVSFGVQLVDIKGESLDELVNTAYVNDVPTTVEIPVRHPKGEEPIEPNPVEPVIPDPETPVDPTPEEPIQPQPEEPVVPKPEVPAEPEIERPEPEKPVTLEPIIPQEPEIEKPVKPVEAESMSPITPPDTSVVKDVKVFYVLILAGFVLLFLMNRSKKIMDRL